VDIKIFRQARIICYLNFTDEYSWFGKVVKCEFEKSFYIEMTDSDKDWNRTTFGFDLVDTEQDLLLKFSHTNWPEINHHFKFSSLCWAMLLNSLKNYLETGSVIPFNERN